MRKMCQFSKLINITADYLTFFKTFMANIFPDVTPDTFLT